MKHNLPAESQSELLFSLHRSSVRLFRTLTIAPSSSTRVFLRLRIDSSDIPESAAVDGQHLHKLEFFVNCRLVKDYQKTISIHAFCRRQQLLVPIQEFRFVGMIDRIGISAGEEPNISLSPNYHELTITSLAALPVNFCVMNDTRYFSLQTSGSMLEPRATTNMIIRVKMDEIKKDFASIRKVYSLLVITAPNIG